MERMVLEVHGVPDVQGDRMTDLLKIHFLSRSNGGDEVLAVIYPTSAPGQAYVVFESEYVPKVLECTHVLDVDSAFYPLQVRRARQSEVDMAVETTLDTRMFSKSVDVSTFARSRGFEVTELGSGRVHLQGSFLDLKLLRKQLNQILAQDLQAQSTSASGLTNGYSSGSGSRRKPVPKPSRSSVVNGERYQRPVVDGESSTSLNFKQQASQNRHPGWGESFRSPNAYENAHHGRTSTSVRREASFLVEKDVMDYVLTYKQDKIKDIEMSHNAEMRTIDDGDVTRVQVLGKHCEKAQAKLQDLTDNIGPQLRTQEIRLDEYNPKQQRQILDRIPLFGKDHNVVIKNNGDVVKLVGTSSESFQVMQKLLGNEEPSKSFKSGSKLRRSLSLFSSQKFKSPTKQGRHLESEDQDLGATGYTPSYSQQESRRSPYVPEERQRSISQHPSSSIEYSSKNSVARFQPHDELMLTSSGVEKSSKKSPKLKNIFDPKMHKANFLKLMKRNKKK